MLKDQIYSPNLQNSNFGDKLSDKFLGTNNVANKNMINNYELQKAVNINKYSWNKTGMIGAGINPLAASNNLDSVSSSNAVSSQSSNVGLLGDVITGLFDLARPDKMIKEARDFVKDIIKNVL